VTERKLSPHVFLSWFARILVAGLFLYAGATKLRDPALFAQEIDNYELLPWLAPYLAVSLPAVELVLGLVLLIGPHPWYRAAGLACGGLMIAFTFAAGFAVFRGLNIDCGCFGGGSGSITWLTLVRDVALVAACALVAFVPSVGTHPRKHEG